MRFKKPGTGQQDLISQIEHAEKLATEMPCSLDKLNAAIDFEIFRGDLLDALGYRDRKDKGGNAPFDPVFMFRIIVLQKYFALSEEQTEFQIRDRFSFMRFLALRPGDEVPDKVSAQRSTSCRDAIDLLTLAVMLFSRLLCAAA